jgi:hypothetical protein
MPVFIEIGETGLPRVLAIKAAKKGGTSKNRQKRASGDKRGNHDRNEK